MAANSAPPIPFQASLPTPQCQWTFLLTELSSLLFYWRALFMVCRPEGCDVHYSNSTFRNISRSFLHSSLYRIFLKKERSSKKEVSYSNRYSHDAPCNFGMSALGSKSLRHILNRAPQHLVIDFLRALEAFVPDDPRQTADKFFKKLSHPYAILNWLLYAIQTMLGDSVLVRSWVASWQPHF